MYSMRETNNYRFPHQITLLWTDEVSTYNAMNSNPQKKNIKMVDLFSSFFSTLHSTGFYFILIFFLD